MSLATRCTTCDTVFRVLQEQLKISQGWVRCGRCQREFNALDGLFSLTSEVPPVPISDSNILKNIEPSSAESTDELGPDTTGQPLYEPFSESQATDDRSSVQDPDARRYAEHFDSGLNPASSDEANAWRNISPEAYHVQGDDRGDVTLPTFIRQAKNDTRREYPRVRIGLSLLALLLAIGLLLQYAIHFRNTLAVWLPQAVPTLSELCRLVACKIEPPLRIDDVVVESGALTHETGSNAFRLVVMLRNRGPFAVAVPSVELTLTDSGGQVVARRTLGLADFYHPPSVLMPATETSLSLLLAPADANIRIAGYTVEAFYP